VVVPVYNEERFIGPCLDAVLRQDEPVHEVIVVDNNSTDSTGRVLTAYGKSVALKRESRPGCSTLGIPCRHRRRLGRRRARIARGDVVRGHRLALRLWPGRHFLPGRAALGMPRRALSCRYR
jgi:glycosyltransferase involved in cell wall biosynthesis